jgi:hypothetical protein
VAPAVKLPDPSPVISNQSAASLLDTLPFTTVLRGLAAPGREVPGPLFGKSAGVGEVPSVYVAARAVTPEATVRHVVASRGLRESVD